jgi:hypothetical protein
VHALEIDFGGRIRELLAARAAGEAPFLLLHGRVVFGYSTSNFAAWQAGFAPLAPTFSVEREGRWVELRRDWGFPAGTPRWMAVDLEGLLAPGDSRLRVETNLEVEWDEVLLAMSERIDVSGERSEGFDGSEAPIVAGGAAASGITVRELAPARAELRFRGFPEALDPRAGVEGFVYGGFHTREPCRALPGQLTRYGDVRELVAEADDRLAVFGPGDEIAFAFAFAAATPAQPGYGLARTYFWKCTGYCKDTDLYTACPDAAEPLPFRAMRSYPHGGGSSDPLRPELLRYREEWNTRQVRAGPLTAVSDLCGGGDGAGVTANGEPCDE